MDDPDLIARLYADGGDESKNVIEELNPTRYIGAQPQSPRDVPFDSTNPSAATSQVGSEAGDAVQAGDDFEPPAQAAPSTPYLELRFSKGPRTSQGFVLGKDLRTSDIVIVNDPSISIRHCAITFETGFHDYPSYRLVVRDLGSTNGTAVEYQDGSGRGPPVRAARRDFRWIINGHRLVERSTIVIELDQKIRLRIDVANKGSPSQRYTENIARFIQGPSIASLLDQLGLPSHQSTLPHSTSQTPGNGPCYLTSPLGSGGFGVVKYWWDVSNGRQLAVKEPTMDALRRDREGVYAMFQKEAKMLRLVKHASCQTHARLSNDM